MEARYVIEWETTYTFKEEFTLSELAELYGLETLVDPENPPEEAFDLEEELSGHEDNANVCIREVTSIKEVASFSP